MGAALSEVCCASMKQEPPRTTEPPRITMTSTGRTTASTQPNSPETTPEESEKIFPEALDKIKPSICLDDFNLVRVLGRGSYGKVFLAIHRKSGHLVALKKLKKAEIVRRGHVTRVLTERTILQRAAHPFLVRLLWSFQSNENLYFAMDFCAGGELFFHLRLRRQFDESIARFYAAEVILALEYIHSNLEAIYRDLKPENVLLDREGHVHLADFGLSKEGPAGESLVGTPEYLAPEVIERATYDRAVDLWALGCFVYELLVGVPPFASKNRDAVFTQIISGKVFFPPSMSDEAIELIASLMRRVPQERLGYGSMDQVKKHRFFRKVDWTAMLSKKVKPPFVPRLDSNDDVRNFDPTCTNEALRSTPAPAIEVDEFSKFTYDANLTPMRSVANH
eukprot:TRINITY_DN10942_c0_g10_i1.p1 TRINITY_DN10942_c0_g10~~TRINITY_DN10942_c0_g10_i1.p1  ORF type:complete len:393 (-),score=52.20 TRINITY_DN10942_c0_g10_i1:32-1210(-)